MTEATTAALADFAVRTDYASLPAAVQREVQRLFVNFVGCALGGSAHQAIRTALNALREFAGRKDATIFGHGDKLDAASASLLNCMSSAVHTFDDTHLSTITHPGGPVSAAAVALSERKPMKGIDLLGAIAVGVEASCRLGAMLTVPPAAYNVSLFMTGITGTVGSALAAGSLLGLDRTQMQHAIGIAATQSAGLREMHGTMASSFVCGNAARAGAISAVFAQQHFTSGLHSIEGPKGFGNVYGNPANPRAVTDGLGSVYELLSITYKPYPCGIAVHPAIDAARDILERHRPHPERIAVCHVAVNPVAVTLTSRPRPATGLEAQVSIAHWVAATLVQGKAGLAQSTDECVRDPAVVAVRDKVKVIADAAVAPTATRLRLILDDGSSFEATIDRCRGSSERPLTDDELSEKFLGQVEPVLGVVAAKDVLDMCWTAAELEDVGAIARRCAKAN